MEIFVGIQLSSAREPHQSTALFELWITSARTLRVNSGWRKVQVSTPNDSLYIREHPMIMPIGTRISVFTSFRWVQFWIDGFSAVPHCTIETIGYRKNVPSSIIDHPNDCEQVNGFAYNVHFVVIQWDWVHLFGITS